MSPAEYIKIRDELLGKKVPLAQAKSEASAIFNSQHPDQPMSPSNPEALPRKKKSKKA